MNEKSPRLTCITAFLCLKSVKNKVQINGTEEANALESAAKCVRVTVDENLNWKCHIQILQLKLSSASQAIFACYLQSYHDCLFLCIHPQSPLEVRSNLLRKFLRLENNCQHSLIVCLNNSELDISMIMQKSNLKFVVHHHIESVKVVKIQCFHGACAQILFERFSDAVFCSQARSI